MRGKARGKTAEAADLLSAIVGTPEDDRLRGTRDDDHLQGLAGDDRLAGGGGNDTLEGGPGRDILQGGRGIDTFVFSPGEGRPDVIRGFDAGETLDLSAYGALSFADDITIEQVNRNLAIVSVEGSTIAFVRGDTEALTEDAFIFG
jgi:Ca2+-binding RTX toxin-like protein